MRKIVYGALALGAALTLSVGSASAADATVVVSGIEGDTLVLTTENAKQVMVGTASAKAVKGKTSKTLKVSAWDTYDVVDGKVTVDLSKIATTKDAYLRIKADGQTPNQGISVKLPKTDVKLKAKYDKGKGTITVSNGKEAYKDATLLWRTANSDYVNDAATDANGVISEETSLGAELERYRMSGGTIYMCVPQQEVEPVEEAFVEEDGTTEIAVQTLDARRSKEAKVTIGKRANAPKVSVNYVTGQITIPKNAQYRVTMYTEGTGAGDLGEFSAKLTEKKILSLAQEEVEGKDDIIVANAPFAVDVVTPGDGAKKPDSKIGHTVFGPQEPTDYVDSVKVEVVAIKKKTDVVNITVENKSQTETYTFFIGDAAKGVTVKPSKTGTLKNVEIKDTTTISVQRVGDKKTETWAGNKTEAADLEGFTGKSLDEIKAVAAGEGGNDTPVENTYTITSSSTKVSSVSAESAKAGETITVTLKTAASTAGFTVTDADGKAVSTTKVGSTSTSKEWSFVMPASDVTIK